MGNTTIKLDNAIIYYADDSVNFFLEEWYNEKDYIIAHTSGSTGAPKNICLSKSDMIKSAIATCKYFGITEKSKLLLPLSPNYIAGKMMIVRAIISGAEIFIETPSNNPIKKDYGVIDLVPIVPSQISSLIQSPYTKNIKNVIIGGGAIPINLEKEVIKSRLNCYATYGMTETCSHIALRKIIDGNELYESLPGYSYNVDNRQCLMVYAPGFTFKKIITNDIVELVDSTHFKWIGRWDNVINSGGIKIFPEEIEKLLSNIIHVPFYITSTSDEKWGEVVTLYIESTNINISRLTADIKKVLRNHFYIPKRIIPVKRFNRTSSGKIIRTKL